MNPTTDTIAIIPAKGHSERLPGKNLALLAGKPLLTHAIEGALASGVFTDVIVSTDDEEIARVARESGALVPYCRPAHLSENNIEVAAVCLDMLRHLEEDEGRTYDTTGILLPTTPFRRPEHIATAYERYMEFPDCPAVMSVTRFEYPPFWALVPDGEGCLKLLFPEDQAWVVPRTDLQPTYKVNGCIQLVDTAAFRARGSYDFTRIVPYEMSPEESMDIDYPEDLRYAEYLLSTSESGATTSRGSRTF